MILEIVCGVAPFAALLAVLVPPSVFLSRWSSSDEAVPARSGRNSGQGVGTWAASACLSHLFLLAAVWLGAAGPSLDLVLVVILLLPIPVTVNSFAWLLACPTRQRFSKTRRALSLTAGIFLFALAVPASLWMQASLLAAMLALFATLNILTLGAVLHMSREPIGVAA